MKFKRDYLLYIISVTITTLILIYAQGSQNVIGPIVGGNPNGQYHPISEIWIPSGSIINWGGVSFTNISNLTVSQYVNVSGGFCIKGDCISSWSNVSGGKTIPQAIKDKDLNYLSLFLIDDLINKGYVTVDDYISLINSVGTLDFLAMALSFANSSTAATILGSSNITPQKGAQILTKLKNINPSKTAEIIKATWAYNASNKYLYRVPITIKENSGSNLTDYRVLITIDTVSLISAGKMRLDCGDIRFTYLNTSNNQEYKIPYWIESGCNTTNTRIWVKVPYIPAKENVTIYMYYGNQNATSESESLPIWTNLSSWVQSIGGASHSCALKSDGTVWCWGGNWYGQLGDGTTTNRYTPVQVRGLTNVTQIALGASHSCALRSDGTVWCWGWNSDGQLGDNTTTNRYTPVQVRGLTNVVQIALGEAHSCALKSDGTVWCWGGNWYGQLGDGTTTNRYTPVRVVNLTNVVQIALGEAHSCALRSDGTVWCWGWNSYGQLGDGTTTNRYTPVQVGGLTNVTQIALGAAHSCALKSDGTVWCWGWNSYGQLGDGTTTNRYTPVQVRGLANILSTLINVTQIALGNAHSCALRSDGTVWCWGNNEHGQLGNDIIAIGYVPLRVRGLTNVTQIALGYVHSCALKSDGTVWCWGWNSYGQLGDNTTTNRYTPVQVLNYNLYGIYVILGNEEIGYYIPGLYS
ncbi:MAG: hypothetical protein BXU00_02990 [Candidatus Nanoclepta minutus]|uniref:RCC1-like domain-containing protein n=1 Tax=Candidatus Nanoclepta minutus TaxID=1940235 RepID=A0A397WM61_9ARCH|nr:MAG: hypothetical protein BXU00_02990 [Candidatus Nanoclepta minutus]